MVHLITLDHQNSPYNNIHQLYVVHNPPQGVTPPPPLVGYYPYIQVDTWNLAGVKILALFTIFILCIPTLFTTHTSINFSPII